MYVCDHCDKVCGRVHLSLLQWKKSKHQQEDDEWIFILPGKLYRRLREIRF